MIEDVKISDLYLQQTGNGNAELAVRQPPENEDHYPEPTMFGELPASGLFVRNVRNLELNNVEVATENLDARPTFWLSNVDGADFFALRRPEALRPRSFVCSRSKTSECLAVSTSRIRPLPAPPGGTFEGRNASFRMHHFVRHGGWCWAMNRFGEHQRQDQRHDA